MSLHRFWIRFNVPNGFAAPRPGCGVTAYNLDDAMIILAETVFSGKLVPEVAEVVEDVDVSTLDQNHVIPNIEAPIWRGVWYPKGFSQNR
ncbi:hypothetical protein DTW90_21920 [Neorhizobium sp. P12A]|uniref:hypothetical protein n=1 Tax=Neorhizobium sp. P12A TaxID=2268027 RepID=UPI0011EFD816|nr:hypothetical protein [Neorhizobium sp. P12A]KAA0695639.1 hypothetical protein DTW90_21920 [Neorhizobium sp. P12A]